MEMAAGMENSRKQGERNLRKAFELMRGNEDDKDFGESVAKSGLEILLRDHHNGEAVRLLDEGVQEGALSPEDRIWLLRNAMRSFRRDVTGYVSSGGDFDLINFVDRQFADQPELRGICLDDAREELYENMERLKQQLVENQKQSAAIEEAMKKGKK